MPKNRIFISYSHESPEHRDQVCDLAERLNSDGAVAIIDHYEQSPEQGWPDWTRRSIASAAFVLLVCTETYRRRFERECAAAEGKGVSWEGMIITQDLYEAKGIGTKYIPVGFSKRAPVAIPAILRGATYYNVSDEVQYKRLLARIEGHDASRRKLDSSTARSSSLLESAFEERADLLARGRDTSAVQQQISWLQRRLRRDGDLKAGDFLLDGRIKLQCQIGQGGFAEVWRAYDRKTRSLVAIKLLHPQFSEDQTRKDRFFRGARQMSRLQHDGIARVVELQAEESGYHFFIMEYLPGGDLRQAVLETHPNLETTISLTLAIGNAVEFAHRQRVVHRDIKPANILLDNRGFPKLTDFDLVRAADTTGGTRTGMLGTFIYTAPESMALAREATAQADIYSLGMTTIFMLYGRDLPFDVMRNPGAFVNSLEIRHGLREVLLSAVAWSPSERPETVETFCRLLLAESGIELKAQRSTEKDRRTSGLENEPAGSRLRPVWAHPQSAEENGPFIDYAAKEINFKIVYCGPCLGGKTSNLEYIDSKTSLDARGRMISLATESGRTLFFDFLPLDLGTIRGFTTRFLLYTVPGAFGYKSSRRLVLKRANGVVFVADSQHERMESNIESLLELKANLREDGLDLLKLPYALQFNKRDLSNAMPSDEMHRVLNYRHEPTFESVALRGVGVFDTLKSVAKQALIELRKR